jgi:hypothetical protein
MRKKIGSDSNGAPSADEVTAASLVMMYADHPGDVTATSRQFRANYRENLVNHILRAISLNSRNDLF